LATNTGWVDMPSVGNTNITVTKTFVVSGSVPTGDLKAVIDLWTGGNQVRVDDASMTFAAVPEPTALSLLGLGLLGCLGRGRRRG
jgi:hypothetical protein